MACSQDGADLWTTLVLHKCPRVAEGQIEVASELPVSWTEVVLVEVVPRLLLAHVWERWNPDELDLEDLRKWIKVRTVRNLETGPTRETCRAAWMTRFIFFIFIFLKIFIYSLRIQYSVCMSACQKTAPDLITDGCVPPCGCWELNSGPLEEQTMLLTTEPSLQPQIYFLNPEKVLNL